MLFTIFCCISTGLAVFCICNRVQRRSIEIAVRLAVREAEKEYEHRMGEMLAQMTAKDGELSKARQLVKLHEAVPTRPVSPPARTAPQVAAPAPAKKLKQDPLNVFEMSRPFTDTSYDALLASSAVVKVEPAGS
jgi:acyl-CoA hydrolase